MRSTGHVFWDTEQFIWPSLRLWYPPLARECVLYRFDRLPAARQKAAGGGCVSSPYSPGECVGDCVGDCVGVCVGECVGECVRGCVCVRESCVLCMRENSCIV